MVYLSKIAAPFSGHPAFDVLRGSGPDAVIQLRHHHRLAIGDA
jgi:hypothetical protein